MKDLPDYPMADFPFQATKPQIAPLPEDIPEWNPPINHSVDYDQEPFYDNPPELQG